MKKAKLAALLLMAVAPTLANAQEQLHAIQYYTQYGDAMGETSESEASKMTEYLYGKNNRLERTIQTGALVGSDEWVLVNYGRYLYDENDNLTLTNSYTYETNSENVFVLKADNDTIDYAYNDKNQLIRMTNRAKKVINDYEYDEQGRLVKDTRTRWYSASNSYQEDMWITYTDFNADGNPQTFNAKGTSSYNNYNGYITYDENGHKTSELHYTDAETPVLNAAEYWTYDETGMLVLYEKKGISSGKEVDSQKTEYEKIDENNIRQTSYTYSSKGWAKKGGSTYVSTYSDFNASKYAPTMTSIEAISDKSQVKIAFTAPEVAGASYNIYRDGMLVTNTTATEYTDNDVENGTHEYFVQTVVDGQNENMSNVLTATVAREYPCATNLHAVTATQTDGTYHVTVAWTNPEITADMKFLNTNIFKVGKYYDVPMLDSSEGELITDPNQTQVTVSFGIDAVQTLYVQTRYQGGAVSSKSVTIDASKILGKTTNDTRKLRVIETYGDAMGETDGISKKEVTYYGENNRIERVAKYADELYADPDAEQWTISEYTSNIYDESNMLVKSYTNKYGRYDFGNMGFQAAKDTTFYENNVEGQVTKEYNNDGYTTYEYNSAGSLIKKHIVQYGTTDVEQTIEYSDFAGKDLPMTTISDGTLNSYKYTLETTYSAEGKKQTEKKSAWSTTYNEYRASQFEKLEYDAYGELAVDSVFKITISNDVETYTPQSFTTYVAEEGNSNRVVVTKKVWDSILKKFGNPKTYNVYEYTDIDSKKYAPTLSVEAVADKMNSVKLTVDVPSSMKNGMTALNLYRNGIEIVHGIGFMDKDYYETDEYGFNGVWTYEDDAVVNGTYDYFVECAEFNNAKNDESAIHNISTPEFFTFNTELPRVTDLKVTDARYTTVQNSTDDGDVEELEAYATLGWTAPANAAEYGIKQYRVMVEGMSIGENDDAADLLATSYELDLRGRDNLTVYIQGVYDLGYSYSDSILVTETLVKQIADKIETINSNLSTLNSNLYNLAGQKVGRNYEGIIISNRKKIIAK